MATSKVLIVDDDPDMLEAFKVMLESGGYEAITACDGASGKAKAESDNPDLILLDIMMEDVDSGLTIAEELGSKFPVILISSIADSSAKVFDTHELPIKGMIQKPVKPDVLLARVKDALQ